MILYSWRHLQIKLMKQIKVSAIERETNRLDTAYILSNSLPTIFILV